MSTSVTSGWPRMSLKMFSGLRIAKSIEVEPLTPEVNDEGDEPSGLIDSAEALWGMAIKLDPDNEQFRKNLDFIRDAKKK